MPATDATPIGCHGRMRQRIVALGVSPKARRDSHFIMGDKYLRALLRSGTVTEEQLQQAVQRLSTVPSTLVWMADADQAVLDRADYVFLAEYGRLPAENDDFQLNGPYHRICRSLEYNWHYYDPQLSTLHRDKDGNLFARPADGVAVVEEPQDIETNRGSAWASAIAVALGLLGGPALALLIIRTVSAGFTSALSVFGIVWVVSLGGLLMLTWPRRVRRRAIVPRCSRCGREPGPGPRPTGCLGCGALFEERARGGTPESLAG